MKRLSFALATATIFCGLCAVPEAGASEALATKSGCATCHAADRKLIGPSWREVAAKYKGRADAVAVLSERVRKGGKGVWGPLPMAPVDTTKVNDADLKAVVTWALKTPS